MRITCLYLAWVVALTGFCLSIYVAEILGHSPCPLCWYQRLALFPLVWILGMAAYRADHSIPIYALPLSLFGLGVSFFQVVAPSFVAPLCHMGEMCGQTPYLFFETLSFPLLSLIGFSLISLLLFFAKKKTVSSET